MKILHTVEYYFPSVGGAQEVVKQLSEHLVMLGHDVTVATTKLPGRKQKIINGVKIAEFDVSGNEVRGYAGSDSVKYQDYLINNKFDVIMNYAAQQWTADLMFKVIDQIHAKKIFVPCGYSGLYNPLYKNYFKQLPAILRKYDATVYPSQHYRDIAFSRKNKLKNLFVIPNGADEREFIKPQSNIIKNFLFKYVIGSNGKLIIAVSNHTGMKGHRETIKAFSKSNIGDATLLIIGRHSAPNGCYQSCTRSAWYLNHVTSLFSGGNKRIILADLNRQDTITAFYSADLFLFLSNIECSPLVLFESAAAGLPFIASDVGNAREISNWTGAGIAIKSSQNQLGIVQVDINKSVRTIEKLISNLELRTKMGQAGRQAWRKSFTWAKITKEYLKLYEGLK